MKRLMLLCLLIPFMGSAQEKATHFENGLTWQQVKAKAKSENKFLLVDCYTTWCGPCKYMSAAIFTQEKVGSFFNENFVNVQVQFDKTKEDNDEVKSWYAAADTIQKESKITAYPTFLIFSPEGKLVHRIVGAFKAEDLIDKAKKALLPENQYYTLLNRYDGEQGSPGYIKQLIFAAVDAFYMEKAEKLSTEYLATQKDLYTEDNLEMLSKFIRNSNSLGFQTILNDPKKAVAALGARRINDIVGNVIVAEEVASHVRGTQSNLDSLIKAAQAKYTGFDFNKAARRYQVEFYQDTENWSKFQAAVLPYMVKYGKDTDVDVLNNFAWGVFENCDSPECINEALIWSKRCADESQSKEPGILDTYANLLYKGGKRNEAMSVQQKAIALVSDKIKKENYQATFDKMKNGQKTWLKK